MCLASFFPEGSIPDLDRLWNGAVINNDGHGFAIVAGDKVITGRGLNPDEVISEFEALRAANPGGPAMFHSRMGTGGLMNTFNCHPFQVGNDPQTVLIHNGVLFGTPQNEKRCDTHIFAQSIMWRQFRRLDRPGVRTYLEKYLGSGNKVVVLTANPRYKKSAYLFNEDAGYWAENQRGYPEWHSNRDYLGYWTYQSRGSGSLYRGTSGSVVKSAEESAQVFANADTVPDASKAVAIRSDSAYLCGFCFKADCIDSVTNVCEECGTCQDCTMNLSDCQCYYMRGSDGKIITARDLGLDLAE